MCITYKYTESISLSSQGKNRKHWGGKTLIYAGLRHEKVHVADMRVSLQYLNEYMTKYT